MAQGADVPPTVFGTNSGSVDVLRNLAASAGRGSGADRLPDMQRNTAGLLSGREDKPTGTQGLQALLNQSLRNPRGTGSSTPRPPVSNGLQGRDRNPVPHATPHPGRLITNKGARGSQPVGNSGRGGRGGRTGATVPGAVPNAGGSAAAPGVSTLGGGQTNSQSFIDQATKIINAQNAPALQNLDLQRGLDINQFNNQQQQIQFDRNRMDNNMGLIYGQLGRQVNDLANRDQSQISNYMGQNNTLWNQLSQQMGNNYSALQGQQTAEQQRMGLDNPALHEGAANGVSRLADTNSLLQGLAGIDRGVSQSIFGEKLATIPAEMRNIASADVATGAQRQAQLNAMSVQELNKLRDRLQTNLDAIATKRSNISSRQGNEIAVLAQKLQAAKSQADLALQLKEQSLGIAQQRVNNQLTLGTGRLGIEQQNADTKVQAEKDRVANQNVVNTLRAKGLELQAQRLSASGTHIKNPSRIAHITDAIDHLPPNQKNHVASVVFDPNNLALLELGGQGATALNQQFQQDAQAHAAEVGMTPSELYNLYITLASTYGK